jgi:hypothetical protein
MFAYICIIICTYIHISIHISIEVLCLYVCTVSLVKGRKKNTEAEGTGGNAGTEYMLNQMKQ